MILAVLCTNRNHAVIPWLQRWQREQQAAGHEVSLCFDKSELGAGDLLFLVSCGQLIGERERARFGHVLVLHASDLPDGRGWSPHVWAILAGAREIVVSLLEAREPVDTGDIWLKTRFALEGHELLPEINERLFAAELDLMTRGVREAGTVRPTPQAGPPPPALRRRTPDDSRLDPDLPIARQFDLLRVVDNERYPAFLELRGHRYKLTIEKVN